MPLVAVLLMLPVLLVLPVQPVPANTHLSAPVCSTFCGWNIFEHCDLRWTMDCMNPPASITSYIKDKKSRFSLEQLLLSELSKPVLVTVHTDRLRYCNHQPSSTSSHDLLQGRIPCWGCEAASNVHAFTAADIKWQRLCVFIGYRSRETCCSLLELFIEAFTDSSE